MRVFTRLAVFLAMSCLMTTATSAQRKMEKLGRGVVATRTATNDYLVSWRLLATENQDIGFNVYRIENGGSATKLNDAVLLKGTNFEDKTAKVDVDNTYFVKTVENGVESAPSGSFTVPANTPIQPYFTIKIKKRDGFSTRGIFVGDLDDDGEYDFVMDKQADNDFTKPEYLEAYKRDGTFLWEINLGPNSIERGNIKNGSSTVNIGHADNWTVYDINQDGKAEVILRTAGGVKFADGKVIDEPDSVKQFISVINGMTGVEMSRVPFNNPFIEEGGDDKPYGDCLFRWNQPQRRMGVQKQKLEDGSGFQ